jgi:hypothetical protein
MEPLFQHVDKCYACSTVVGTWVFLMVTEMLWVTGRCRLAGNIAHSYPISGAAGRVPKMPHHGRIGDAKYARVMLVLIQS